MNKLTIEQEQAAIYEFAVEMGIGCCRGLEVEYRCLGEVDEYRVRDAYGRHNMQEWRPLPTHSDENNPAMSIFGALLGGTALSAVVLVTHYLLGWI